MRPQHALKPEMQLMYIHGNQWIQEGNRHSNRITISLHSVVLSTEYLLVHEWSLIGSVLGAE